MSIPETAALARRSWGTGWKSARQGILALAGHDIIGRVVSTPVTDDSSVTRPGTGEPRAWSVVRRTLGTSFFPALPQGAVVQDKYRVTGLLEMGPDAAVYRADHALTGRLIILRLFHAPH